MAKPSVYVTRRLPPPGLELLANRCDVLLHEGEGPPSREELLRNVRDKDGLLCLLTDRVDAELMDAAPSLKVVSSLSVGFEHINVNAATQRGVYVTYTPGVLTEATADFTWALILGAARRLAEADRYVRGGRWSIAWTPTMMLGENVYGKALGIIGLGRIGRAVARRAVGFKMKTIYHDVARAPPEVERELRVAFTSLDELLRVSDFVSIHVPASKENRHLIDEARLRLMKPTAYLINTARGSVVDEGALAKALKEGWIAGAALDVYEKEPLGTDSPLLTLDNVILAPHIASASTQARSAMAELAAKNLLAVLKGEPPISLVNPEVERVRPLSQVKVL